LLDIAVALDFATSGIVFFSYSEPGSGGAAALARAKLIRDDPSRKAGQRRSHIQNVEKTDTNHHFGSRIVPRPDGTIFITTGDRGQGDRAQDMFDHAGAVIASTRTAPSPGTILSRTERRAHRNSGQKAIAICKARHSTR
jgi:glucose/arabinose dehydrogenase